MLPRLSPKPSRWKYFALLSIILVFAVGIRLYLASNQARCSHDNYFSLLDEHGIPTWQMEANGLLHYYQDYYLKQIFRSESNLEIRRVPVFYGIMSLPLMFWLGYLVKRWRGGLWASFLLAINISHLGITTQDRFYACGVFFSILSTCCLLKSSQGRVWRFAHLAYLCGAILTMFTNVFLFLPHLVCLRYQPRTKGNRLHQLALVLTTIVSAVFLILWENRSCTQFGYDSSPIEVIGDLLMSWINGGATHFLLPGGIISHHFQPPYITLCLGGFALAVSLFCWHKQPSFPSSRQLAALGKGSVASLVLALVYSTCCGNMISFPNMFWVLPLGLVLIGSLLCNSRYAGQLFLLGLLALPPQAFQCTYIYSSGVDTVFDVLSEHWKPRDTIITTTSEMYNGETYCKAEIQKKLAAPVASNHLILNRADDDKTLTKFLMLQHTQVINPSFSHRVFVIDYGGLLPPAVVTACVLTNHKVTTFGNITQETSSRLYMIDCTPLQELVTQTKNNKGQPKASLRASKLYYQQ